MAKIDKEQLLKNKFWIMLGSATLLLLICWLVLLISGSSAGDEQRKKFESNLMAVQNNAKGTPKNDSFTTPWDEYGEKFTKQKVGVWKQAWDTQATMYTWPWQDKARLDQLQYYDDELKPDSNAARKIYAKELYAKQFEGLDKLVAPVEFKDGETGFKQIMAPAMAAGGGGGSGGGGGGRGRWFVEHELRVEQLERAATEHRERAVRRHAGNRFVVLEVVAELGVVGVFAVLTCKQPALEQALAPQPVAQRAHEHRVFGPTLAENVSHTVEHGVGIGKAGIGLDVRRGLRERVERGVGEQRVGERLDTRLARDHGLGAAFDLEWQVEVFEILLGRRGVDGGAQCGR